MIQKISAEDLKKMQDREGLVLQGCGGDLREWEDGIHQMLAEEKILQNGAHFKEIYAFEHEGCTNLLFMMDGIELDTGRLALRYRAMIPASGPTAFWHFSAACSLCLQRKFWTLLRCS